MAEGRGFSPMIGEGVRCILPARVKIKTDIPDQNQRRR
jgi:hypothetical protein